MYSQRHRVTDLSHARNLTERNALKHEHLRAFEYFDITAFQVLQESTWPRHTRS